ncbi:MAG: hypothetical protein KGJ84_16300 [Elusimicrobia bacterium]|nr:hypothetical protein [Elusimicrobiota bacterium]
MRVLAMAVLLVAGAANAAQFMGKTSLPGASASDTALCLALGASGDRLRGAFAKGSDFPDSVYAAFEGQGSGDASAVSYLNRGQDLYQLVATVEAQCRATFGYNAGPRSDSEAAAIRRRAQSAKKSADLYLNLPLIIANIDSAQNPAELGYRPQYLTAMYKIADGGNYEAAAALTDAAQASRGRIRR